MPLICAGVDFVREHVWAWGAEVGCFFQGVGHFFQGDVLIQSIKGGLKVRGGEFYNIGVDLVDEGVWIMGLE